MALSDFIEPYLPSMRSVLIFFFVVYLPMYMVSITFFRRRKRKTPFSFPSLISLRERKLITDQRVRDASLRQHFNIKRVPEQIDVIVVGSNTAGLITAGLLARSGIRVLVLERYSTVGGKNMEKELENGYIYESDQHFGNMRTNSILRLCLDQVTNGGLRWKEIDTVIDDIFICQGNRRKRLVVQKDEFQSVLLKEFPTESAAIKRYFLMLDSVQKSLWHALWTKVLPLPIINLLKKLTIFDRLSIFFHLSKRSVQDVLKDLTSNEELIAALSYMCYDTHESLDRISFVSHAFRMNQILSQGAFYPVGGFTEIAFNIVSVINAAKGKVLVGAPVAKLLSNDRRVTGVNVCIDKISYNIYSKTVIIADGVINATELLPKVFCEKINWLPILNTCNSKSLNFKMQIWMKTCPYASNLKPQNMYFFMDGHKNNRQRVENWLRLSSHDASNETPPYYMVSCPSLKDSKWEDRFGKNISLLSVSFIGSRKWVDDLLRNDNIKIKFTDTIWKQIIDIYPQLKEVSIKNVDIHINHDFIYTENVPRYSFDMQSTLRPDFGVNGFVLTGSDIFIGGYIGEIYSAILSSSYYLNRNLMNELVEIQKGIDAGKV